MSFKDYCTMSPDKIFGVYVGDACEAHDWHYQQDEKSNSRKEVDLMFRRQIEMNFEYEGKPKLGKVVAFFYYWAVRAFSGRSWERWKYRWLFGIIPIKR